MPKDRPAPPPSGLPLREAALGLVLTATAGWIDAIGFLRLSGLYTSFMSGNTTQFAVALGQRNVADALPVGGLLAAFAGGSVLGGMVKGAAPARWIAALVLTLEAGLLGTAGWLALTTPDALPATLLLAFAMGAQNAALPQASGFRAGATFVTGALSGFGQKLGLALTGRGPRWGWTGDGLVWIGLLIGGTGGAVAYGKLALAALLPPAVLTAALAAGMWVAAGLAARRRARGDTPAA